MAVTIQDIVKYLMFVAICILGTSAEQFLDLEEMTEMLQEVEDKMVRVPRQVEGRSWIWQEYEFGSGVGNREELIITDIKTWQDSNLPNDIKSWKFFEYNYEKYLIGRKNSTLLLYQFNLQTNQVSHISNVSVTEKIKTFKIISLERVSPLNDNRIYLIVSVESSNKTNFFKWYYLQNRRFFEFTMWDLSKPTKSLEYAYLNNDHKLFILYEDITYFTRTFSIIQICDFKISSNFDMSRSCNEYLIPPTSHFQICSLQKKAMMILLFNEHSAMLYEYKEGDFNSAQNITVGGLNNAICFENGNMHYFAASGIISTLFEFQHNECPYEKKNNLFYDMSETRFIQSLPADTYREEVILLVQLKNSSVLALGWQGLEFKLINLPNQILNSFDLSKVTIIPNFGFLKENTFVKFKVMLKNLAKPNEKELGKILNTKYSLKNILKQQESIISKTNLLIEESYLNNDNRVEGILSLVEVTTDNLEINETNDFPISIGAQNLTLRELQSVYENVEKKLSKIDKITDEIEYNVKTAVITNYTNMYLSEVEIFGDLEVKGTLRVDNLSINKLNDISMDTLIKNCRKKGNIKIKGMKSFTSIAFTDSNLEINKINGVPLSQIQFDKQNQDYTGIDLSKVNKLQIFDNFNFTRVFGMDWSELMKRVVFKNKTKVIPGRTIISRQLTADHVFMEYLNDIKYPEDYVLKGGPELVNMTGEKYFEKITINNLLDLQTINGIDADEFIILNADQKLDHLITFENIVIDESFQVKKNIIGLPEQDIDPDLTLLNSNIVQSNAMFTKLLVMGKVYVENSINGSKWEELDDVLLRDEANVTITGKKQFLNNVNFSDNLEIKTNKINGHSINDFLTVDTEQVLRNLIEISGNIEFTEVSYEVLRNLESKINSDYEADILLTCLNKTFIFEEPPIIDEFSSLYVNEHITGLNFELASLLTDVYFENLQVKNLLVNDLNSKIVNGVNLQEFVTQKLSKYGYQELSGDIKIKNLDVENLQADFVNNRSINDLKNTVEKLSTFYNDIFRGKKVINSINVTNIVVTSKINDEDLIHYFELDCIDKFIFKTDKLIKNIIVDGFINNLNFTTKIQDIILKTDDNLAIAGPKKFRKLKAENLLVQYINGHSVEDVVSSDKNQTLTGPVTIKGSVKVENFFNSIGKINYVIFEDIYETIRKIDNNIYKLTGNFLVEDTAFVENLYAFGEIHGKNIVEFLDNLIYLNDKDAVVTGTKIFNNVINFFNKVTIIENLNNIDLKTFYQNVVLLNRSVSIDTQLNFENDILLHGNLTILNNLKVDTIKDFNLNNLIEGAVYLNRPTFIEDALTFSNVIFESDIIVDTWNNVKMDSLFTLHTNEVIEGLLICHNVSVDNIEIRGFVNGEHLKEIYENTLMLSTDQNITGKITFLNNVDVQSDFDSPYINSVDMTRTISLNNADPLVGNFVFNSPVTVNGNLNVHGYLNELNFSKWISNTIVKSSPRKQIFTGNWRVHGNVDFKQKFNGNGSVNRVDISKLFEDIEKKNKKIEMMFSNKMKKLKVMCQDLLELKNEAENMLYKFKSFEYLDILDFNQNIASIHNFELKEVDYIMVNFESCHLDVLEYTDRGFIFATKVPNFGYVKQYITFTYGEILYFVTLGKPECGKSSGNVWSLENYQFKHILILGNITDFEKIGNDAFVVLLDHQVQEWNIKDINERKFIPTNIIPIDNKNAQFFSNNNDTLLASTDTIYDLRPDILQFEEYENPFSTNNILTFQAGVNQKEYILFSDDRISSEYIFICNTDLSHRKVLQTINSLKPSSFMVLNFDKFQENILIFSENKREIRIYEYKGIEGFKYHSSIKMKHDKMFNFQLRVDPDFVKKTFLAVIQDNRLTILEAKMYGSRLDINEHLICDDV